MDTGGTPFTASGRARFIGPDGEVEGDLEVRLAPPDRAWVQVRSRALFGMVGERVVASLPGDGYLIVYEERAERLQRVPFDSTQIASLCPAGGPECLLALLRGRLPRALVGEGVLATARARASDSSGPFRVELRADGGGGLLQVRLDGDDLQELDWQVAGVRRLWIRYEKYAVVGAESVPTRIRVEAPAAGIRAEVEIRHVVSRPGLDPRLFDVGSGGNSGRNRGVDHG